VLYWQYDTDLEKEPDMLRTQIRDDDIAALKQLSDAGRYADHLLTADILRQEFEGGVIRRKSFCEALDIGESTLSTWLQAGRIPRVAAVAYVLWLAVRNLANEIRRRDELTAEPYVIHCRDGYAVVRPVDSAVPDAIDQVIASGIETVELAQEIATARSNRFRKVLDRALDVLCHCEEQFDEDDNHVAEIMADLERAQNFKVGPVTLDDLAKSVPTDDKF
jgi:hypothetical protein